MMKARLYTLVAVALAGAGSLAVAGPALADAPLTVEQQSASTAFAAKALAAINALPASSSPGAFEGAIIDAMQGAQPAVIAAAMAQVAGTPGIPAAATQAALRVKRSYANNDTGPTGTGAIGTFGGSTPGAIAPGFASGGGGGSSSSYTH